MKRREKREKKKNVLWGVVEVAQKKSKGIFFPHAIAITLTFTPSLLH